MKLNFLERFESLTKKKEKLSFKKLIWKIELLIFKGQKIIKKNCSQGTS